MDLCYSSNRCFVCAAQGSSQQSEYAIFHTTGLTLVDGISKPVVAVEDPGELNLQWTKPLDSGGTRISGYVVRARQWHATNATWSELSVVYNGRNSVMQSAKITGLTASTRYGFTVITYNYRSVCVADDLLPSGEELVMTTKDGTTPYEPKNLRVAGATGGAVTVAWDSPLSSGGEAVLAYVVYGGITNENLFVLASVDVSAPRIFTMFGLQMSSDYQFTVCAENIRGLGRNATTLNVTTLEATPPSEPTNLQQIPSTSGGSINLSWDPPDDTGGVTLQSYGVYRNASLVATIDAMDGRTEFTDMDNVEASQIYHYSVFAVNSLAPGIRSAVIYARSPTATRPQPPSVNVVETSGGFMNVEWMQSLDSGGIPVTGYKVVLTRNGTDVAVYEGMLTYHMFQGLFAVTEYRVSAQTQNALGLSLIAKVLAITDVAEKPAQPAAPNIIGVFGGRVRFEATSPDDFGGSPVTSYQFFINDQPVDAIPVSTNVYDIVELTAETEYSFTVAAKNIVGQGDASNPIRLTTSPVSQPGIVAVVEVETVTFESIEIAWEQPRDTGGAPSLMYSILVKNSVSGLSWTIVDVESPYNILDLEASTYYAIQVRGENSADIGEWSDAVIAKTDPVSPGTMSFMYSTASVSEGNSTIKITVVRSSGGSTPAACSYRTMDGTALDGVHYVGASESTIHFDAGIKQQTLTIAIINNDVLDDPDRFFYVQLLEIDFESGNIGAINTTNVTITDDGDAGLIQFSQTSYSVVESTSSVLVIPLVRTKSFSGSTVIHIDALDILDGATENVDYVLLDSTVTFADQQVGATVQVKIMNDAVFQIRKFFGLNLTIASGRAGVGSLVPAFVEILDDGDASRPWPPKDVKVAVLSGGWVNVNWTAPENKGVANATFLSYRVVLTSDMLPTQELTTFNTSLNITSLAAKSMISVAVAGKNSFFESFLSAPVLAHLGAPTPPTVPQAVQIQWRTGGAVNLTWLAPFDQGGADILLYRVNVSTGVGSNFTLTQYTTQSTSFAVYGLQSLTDYNITVQAQNYEGLNGTISPVVKFTTRASSAPSKPPGVNVTKSTGGALYLDLVPSLDLGGLNITKFTLSATSPEFPNVYTDIYEGTSSKYVMSRLPYLTEYKLRYKVTNAVGVSELSDVLVTKTKFVTLPDEPGNVTVLGTTGGSATMSWVSPLDFGGTDITSYEVTFFTGYEVAAQYKQLITNVSTKATMVTAKVSGLNSTTTYGLFVRGVNDLSACGDSSTLSSNGVVYGTTLNFSAPEVPQNLNVTLTTAGMQVVSWSPTNDRGGDPMVQYVLVTDTNAFLYNGTQTSFRRGSLSPNTTYGYTVMAKNAAGTSTHSPVVYRTTQSRITIPSAPLNLVFINATGGSITLSWAPPVDSGGEALQGYRVFRDSKPLPLPNGTLYHQNTTYVDSYSLVAEKNYLYTVQAGNSLGGGPFSDGLQAQPNPATLPRRPKNLTVIAVGGKLSLTWTPPSDTGGVPLEGFYVNISRGDTLLFNLRTNATSYDYYGIYANTNYTGAVAATSKIGDGPPSVRFVMNANATRPAAPLPPELVSSSAQSVVLALKGPRDNGGANITALKLYQDGVFVRSVQTSGYFQVVVGPLFASKVYSFTTTAVSITELGESPQSDVVQAITTNPTGPSIVYNLAVTGRTFDSLTLVWEGPDDIGGENVVYDLEYNVKLSTVVAMTATTMKNITINGLTPITSYMVRVKAMNSAGTSGWTAFVQGDTDVTQRGVIVFRSERTTVFENVTSVTFDLMRVNGMSSNITCYYDVAASSTAKAGTDFVLPSLAERTFAFVDGETLKNFTIPIINGVVYEATPRELALVLRDTTPDRSDVVAPQNASIFILDDGDAGWIDFSVSNMTVLENASTLNVPLQRLNGSSSATAVRVSVYDKLVGTAVTPIDFTIATPVVTFADGQTSQNATIRIVNNTVYDYPLKYFYITVTNEAGGGQIGPSTVIMVTILDDSDRSPPGLVRDQTLVTATGGMISLTWTPPMNVGGQKLWITKYNLTITAEKVNATSRFFITKDNSTEFAFGGLDALTVYNFQIAAMNAIWTGNFSAATEEMTTNFTTPGVMDSILLLNATGGLLTIQVAPPMDIGGAFIDKYFVYIATSVDPEFKVRVACVDGCVITR